MAHPLGVDADHGSAVDPLARAGYVCILLAVPLVTFNVLRAPGNLTYGDPLLLVGGLLLGLVWLKRGHPPGVVPIGFPVGAALMLVAGLLAILPAGNSDAVAPTLRFILAISLMPLILMFAASTRKRQLIGRGYSPVRPSHNLYLQLVQAGGVIALAGFLVFVTAILRRARRLARPAADLPPWLSAIAAGSGASLGVLLLSGIAGPQTHDRYLYLPVGLVLALGLLHRRIGDSGRRTAPVAHERPWLTASMAESGPRSALRHKTPEPEPT